MNRLSAFIKRNFLEMLRDPVLYVFCVGFPVVLIAMFAVINSFTDGNTPVFEPSSLIPGIVVFSYTFVMLTESLLVSKDRKSAFIVRLYASPMKTREFVAGYAVPCLIAGIAQAFACIIAGWITSLIAGAEYFSFARALLLVAVTLPSLITFVFLGIFIGSALNDKAAPGICSVFISAAGVLGGAWMPLETMGSFETFCRFLPFYPPVDVGRAITGAKDVFGVIYRFDSTTATGFIAIAVYLAVSAALAVFVFGKKSSAEIK